jgi:hypothetical protein
MALSLRTPRPDGKRPSMATVRPVATTTIPQAVTPPQQPASGLSFYVTLGFAVGIGIVVAARLTVTPSGPTAAATSERVESAPVPALSVAPSAALPIATAPSSVSPSSASPSSVPAKAAAPRRGNGPRFSKPQATDPLSRRK